MPKPAPLSPIPERYEALGELGRGGMGVVLRARDRELEREVALKLIHPEVASGKAAARFIREVRHMGKVSHPHVVGLLDADVAGESPYIAMELLAGEALSDLRRREGPLPPVRVTEILEGLLAGLAAVHDAGLLHRDLKPSNVFLDEGRGPVLVDFGLARPTDSATVLTSTGAVVGTPRYFAPEILRGEDASVASDLFAVGLVGADLLLEVDLHTGATRGAKVSIPDLLSSLGSGAYLDVARRELSARGPLGCALLRALAREPADRWEDARSMAGALGGSPPGANLAPAPEVEDTTLQVPIAAEPRSSPARSLLLLAPLVAVAALWPGGNRAPAPPPPITEVARPRMPASTLLERFVPSDHGEDFKERIYDLAAVRAGDPDAAATRARELLAASGAAALPPDPAPLEADVPAAAMERLYLGLLRCHLLERLALEAAPGDGGLLRWLPTDRRPGAVSPAGCRIVRSDLTHQPGFRQRASGEEKFFAVIQSGGLNRKLTFEVSLDDLAGVTRAWLVLRAPGIDWGDVFEILIPDRASLRLLSPPGRLGFATHEIPPGLLVEGPNVFKTNYRSVMNPERTLPELEAFEVHLLPRDR